MKKTLVNVLALILAVALIMSLAACGGSEAGKTEAGSTTSGVDSQDQNQTTAATEKPKEPVTLTYYGGLAGNYASGIQDDPVAKEIEKRTGVTVDWEFHTSPEKFNAMLASGDLPDIISIDGPNYVKQLIEGGNIIDMDPLLKSNGQDILKETPEKVDFCREFYSIGQNKLYFLTSFDQGMKPNNVKTFNANLGLWVRWDYYKELGYPEIKDDVLEIIPILKQMQDKHPTTDDGKKVYGVSPWLADWDLWNFTVFHQGYINRDAEKEKFVDIDFRTDEVFSQIGDPASSLWQGVQFYNKCKQGGILDPDSVTQKYDNFLEKAAAGRVLFSPVSWAVGGFDTAAAKAGHPEQGFMPVKLPSKITAFYSERYNPVNGRWLWAITRNCETPDRAMDLINYIMSYEGTRLMYNGIEGKDWAIVGGIPQYTKEFETLMKEDPDWAEKTGATKYFNAIGRDGSVTDPKYNCPINFGFNRDLSVLTKDSKLATDYTQHYKVSYPFELFEKQLTGNIKTDGTYFAMVEPTTTEIKQIDDKLLNYLTSSMVKLVLAKDDTAFEAGRTKIIEDCKNMGYEQAFQWHKKAYEDAKAKYEAMK